MIASRRLTRGKEIAIEDVQRRDPLDDVDALMTGDDLEPEVVVAGNEWRSLDTAQHTVSPGRQVEPRNVPAAVDAAHAHPELVVDVDSDEALPPGFGQIDHQLDREILAGESGVLAHQWT